MEHDTTEQSGAYRLPIESGDVLVVDAEFFQFVSTTGTGLVNIARGSEGDGEIVSMPATEFEQKLERVHITR